eukprot:CAMPEP_0204901226 /NCGR_PEP_ID=MMETSP1397-20131031/2956_1 /ASSEMBLY_ACC=CAM_ASM_000891 /TAXON_ID=49980 /ORGANISM="Climacostomum Climacostomum virens, Strain Stock W-24" /LENGTH=117 /DNA_ID=CAMNT_0052069547 /DNA_START=259 /DNA_END=612 /DNA_ORIENTATION=+
MEALDLLSQFVVLFQQKRYQAALDLCGPILALEPSNPTILEFRQVLTQKLAAGEIDASESSEESEESQPEDSDDLSGEEDEEDLEDEDEGEEDEEIDDAETEASTTRASTARSMWLP